MRDLDLLLTCLIVRLVNSIFTGLTVFNPDEYWQSLEVAYAQVWSGGFIPWEFQDHARLRGVLHPLIFTTYYAILELLGLDSRAAVAHGPRTLQGIIAGVGDYYLYRLAHRLIGRAGARWTLFCSFICWFTFYCLTRTLSNSLECSLCMVAFYYWPDTSGMVVPWKAGSMKDYERSRRKALLIAAFTFVIRPTNALIWLMLGVYHLIVTIPVWSLRIRLLRNDVLPIAAITFILSSLLDTVFYETRKAVVSGSLSFWAAAWDVLTTYLFRPWQWTIVSLNFLRLNSGTDLSSLYGTHPWHWYFSQGLPVNLGPMFPVFIWAVVVFWRQSAEPPSYRRQPEDTEQVVAAVESRRSLNLLLAVMVWCMVTYSFNPHKEFRFILCVTPIPFLFVARMLFQMEEKTAALAAATSTSNASSATELSSSPEPTAKGLRKRTPATKPAATGATTASPSHRPPIIRWGPFTWLVSFLVFANVPMAAYLTFVHQSGPALVLDHFDNLIHRAFISPCVPNDTNDCTLNIHFFLDCHSMPFYSYLHQGAGKDIPTQRSINLQFLDCSPLFVDGQLRGNGYNPCSASALFDAQPDAFLRAFYYQPPPESPRTALLQLHTQNPARSFPWPWYLSRHHNQCLEAELRLNATQIASINNELPGGGSNTPPTEMQKHAWIHGKGSLLPHIIVMTSDQAVPSAHWLDSHKFAHHSSFFHSHIDGSREFFVFALLA